VRSPPPLDIILVVGCAAICPLGGEEAMGNALPGGGIGPSAVSLLYDGDGALSVSLCCIKSSITLSMAPPAVLASHFAS